MCLALPVVIKLEWDLKRRSGLLDCAKTVPPLVIVHPRVILRHFKYWCGCLWRIRATVTLVISSVLIYHTSHFIITAALLTFSLYLKPIASVIINYDRDGKVVLNTLELIRYGRGFLLFNWAWYSLNVEINSRGAFKHKFLRNTNSRTS